MKRSILFTLVICVFAVEAEADLMLDLTTSGSTATINDAWFYEAAAASTGSGVIMSFVRVSTNDAIEEGYNTDYRPLEFDENTSATFTRSLLLSSVPIVNLGGTDYREFLLDINQNNSPNGRLLSLDEIEIYLGSAGNLTGYPSGLGTLIWELDDGANNWIKLDGNLNSGSGGGDMFAYIPDDLFIGDDYVYLYSRFGENFANTSGFEEWAVRTEADTPVVPVPGAVILGLLGLGIAGLKLRKYA